MAQLRWRSEITADEAQAALGRLIEMAVEPHESRQLIRRAEEIAHERGWAKTYDAEYVALAEVARAPLVTVDARLHRALVGTIDVRGPADL